ncbi:Stm1 [Nakaseomyces glabratus]|nr:Stm1 [Nakaseomyces glabratus]KAH7589825.1 Stm1 [Nakaseomyces glabratus]KAH7595714.1 Stm1 [Nakaseomyces glabratus]KAH7605357.1 Stm1 [Nakaseomyces glabratus]KAH7614363.1 Stm1 [Nakaseomyces glabratus]
MSNPFDLLGNDVEDPQAAIPLATKEIVKKSTSSKKADVPPPSADPAKARKNKGKLSGNEGAIRDKKAGRDNNRARDVGSSATARRNNDRKMTDRHSRTGKTDSQKKINQAWGDNDRELTVEEQAKRDAESELAEDAEAPETQPAGPQKMSLADYMNQVDNNDLNKVPEARKVEETLQAEAKSDVPDYAPATKTKAVKSKQLKTKEFLQFDATFSDNNRDNRDSNRRGGFRGNSRGGRGGNRGGNRGGKSNSSRGGKNTAEVNKKIDTSSLPSLI